MAFISETTMLLAGVVVSLYALYVAYQLRGVRVDLHLISANGLLHRDIDQRAWKRLDSTNRPMIEDMGSVGKQPTAPPNFVPAVNSYESMRAALEQIAEGMEDWDFPMRALSREQMREIARNAVANATGGK